MKKCVRKIFMWIEEENKGKKLKIRQEIDKVEEIMMMWLMLNGWYVRGKININIEMYIYDIVLCFLLFKFLRV